MPSDSRAGRASARAPFRVRSFRFQWTADLFTSLAFEMETLILGWYVLTATGSVEQLVLFGALVWLGSLFSPFFGVVADRIGHRTVLCATRSVYLLLAGVLAALTLRNALLPWHVFAFAAVAGLIRPSDQVMRQALVGETMRPEMLLGALGISRTTSDTARVAGALAGTGGVALVGMGAAYVAVTVLYVAAFLLSLGVARSPRRTRPGAAATHPLADLKETFAYVWRKPDLLGAFCIAFLANLLAFPFVLGLLPYVAKEVYGVGQSGLGYLAAAFSSGALAGSLVVGANRLPLRPARAMLLAGGVWFATVLAFGQTRTLALGLPLLFLMGLVQSFCLTPLAAVMLRSSGDGMLGRVMGMRQLAVWGLPLGLLAAGPLVEYFGYPATTILYATLGLAATCAIGYRWHGALWHRSAVANARM
jgi:predicted MFS family arabinose efflux permease